MILQYPSVEEELEFSERAHKAEIQQYRETIIKLESTVEQSENALLENQVFKAISFMH